MTERAKSDDERKTKERLIHELQFLRQKVTDSDRLLDEITSMYKEAPIGLCVFDLNLRYMHINRWLATINGVPVEEHLGRTVREVLPDVAEGVEPQLRHVIETREPILGGTVEAETPARPGIRRTFQHNYYPIKSGDDTVIGVSCVVEDVTELRRAEETLKESERTLASAQRIAGLGHWLWDEVENRIITVSEQLARIFGVEPEKFPRTSEGWFAFIHPDDRARAVAEIERCIANRSGFDLEYRIVRSDGQIHFVRDLSEPLFDDSGRFVRTLGTLLDITELKQVEQALRESEERLRASLREKEVLLEEVHHRVKNNFQVIALLLSVPTSVPRHEHLLEALEEIKRRVLVMARLYEHLLASEHLDHVDTKDFLTEIINHLATGLVSEDRQPRFRVDIEDVALTIDHALVCGQIISELVSNSLKHAFTGNSSGTVDICLRKASDTEFLLTVKDDGVGLSENFDVEACEGFGLRIVTALVNQLGGAIEANGSQGASFQIKFSEKRR